MGVEFIEWLHKANFRVGEALELKAVWAKIFWSDYLSVSLTG